uniref:Uncharacterized protein n=1 Tax=Steinernema glaseri TaxID=37863 RepID=A0A1I8A7D4_9BILA
MVAKVQNYKQWGSEIDSETEHVSMKEKLLTVSPLRQSLNPQHWDSANHERTKYQSSRLQLTMNKQPQHQSHAIRRHRASLLRLCISAHGGELLLTDGT